VKALGILHIVLGCCGVLAGFVALALLNGIAGLVGVADVSGDALIAVPILGGLGVLAFGILTVISLPGIIAGFGLLSFRPWARTLTIVLCAIHILNFPLGTALGVYGLWVLLKPGTEALFGLRTAQAHG
jgi:hypothetical protein